jgi:hypothetical protein
MLANRRVHQFASSNDSDVAQPGASRPRLASRSRRSENVRSMRSVPSIRRRSKTTSVTGIARSRFRTTNHSRPHARRGCVRCRRTSRAGSFRRGADEALDAHRGEASANAETARQCGCRSHFARSRVRLDPPSKGLQGDRINGPRSVALCAMHIRCCRRAPLA